MLARLGTGLAVMVLLSVLILPLVFGQEEPVLPRIAHAGGAINGLTYTNSIEALETNLARGFTHFEIDFSWTRDGQLVCLHDWEESFERSFGRPASGPVSLAEFEALVEAHSSVQKCTLASAARWFAAHPGTVLISDVKQNNADALQHIRAHFPALARQMIPQIYQPEEYQAARSLGSDRLIWTLYRFAGNSREVIRQLENMRVWAVTMDTVRTQQGLARQLDELGIPSYTHTINDYADFLYFQTQGIDEIYTDDLSPQTEARLLAENPPTIADSAFYQAEMERRRLLDERTQEFRNRSGLRFALSENNWRSLEFLNQISMFRPAEPGISFQSTGDDPYFTLPALAGDASQIELLLKFSVEDSGVLEVFYETLEARGFSEARKLRQPFQWGQNTLFFTIDAPSPVARLRVDPGLAEGRYHFQEIEIRAE